MASWWRYTVPLRLQSIFRRSQVEQDLDEEFRFHLEQRIAYEIAAGKTPEEAGRAALLAMDGMEQRKEECRDMRHMNMLDNLLRDVRYGVRTLARSPGFTLAALLALALGIGANTAVFSVVNSVLLRPLPYADPDRLVMIFNSRPEVGNQPAGGGLADFLDWRARSRSFQALEAMRRDRFTLTGGSETEQIVGMNVSAGLFETLGVRPMLGRTFAAGEDQPGRPLTIVLSERLWRRRYASDEAILGKTVMVNSRPHTVIGVMPAGFETGPEVEVWAILTLNPPTRRGPFVYRTIGRLKPGVTVAQAAAEMNTIAREVRQANPRDYNDALRFPVIPMREVIVSRVRPLLWVLSGAVLLVLLISVSNVANLMLARATARQRETAIRLSIGAGRGQLVRQCMTESVMLSLAGGAMGVTLAYWGVAVLRLLGPRDLPRLNEISVDWRVLAFTLLVSLASSVIFGLAPSLSGCWGASTAALNDSLKQGGRAGDSRGQRRVRGVLVIAQVTLSVLLLIGAGLLIRSFSLLGRVNPGFTASPDRVLTMSVRLTGSRYSESSAVTAYMDQLLGRVRALPGVEAASVAITIPPNRLNFTDDYEIESKPLPPGERQLSVPVCIVSQDYLKTLGVPLLRGRWFDGRERAETPRATVISQAMARMHFAGEDPIGQRFKYSGRSMEIIGVVGDVKYQGLEREDEPAFYMLSTQVPFTSAWLLVRTHGDARGLATAVRSELRRLDPGVPADRVSTMTQALSESVALPRFRSLLMAVFACTALLLAAIGIYGVIGYSVAQRTQEIGVRMALGATRGRVLRLVIAQGSRLAIAGIVFGLAGAFGLTRFLEKMVFGISTSDTLVFGGAAFVLGAVAVAASLIPALRAARIDPVTALRQD